MINWEDKAEIIARMPDLHLVGKADAAGKSAAWFFFSSNQKYMLKLATAKEKDLMVKILPEYHKRLKAARADADERGFWLPNSLLPQIYGMYTVNMDGKETHWLVMKNILASGCKIHEKYDLKGSNKGRNSSRRELDKGFGAVLKDNDFRRKKKTIGTGAITEILTQALAADKEFLVHHKLIDYSLLVGSHHKRPEWRAKHEFHVGDIAYVEDVDMDGHPDKRLECVSVTGDPKRAGWSGEEEPLWELGAEVADGSVIWRCESCEAEGHELSDDDRKTLTYSETQNELVFFGIIDILTEYTFSKMAEKKKNSFLMCAAPSDSCQTPEVYGRRFEDFIAGSMVAEDLPAEADGQMDPSMTGGRARMSTSIEAQQELVSTLRLQSIAQNRATCRPI
jgi:1-phosphatidylinositol-4-phosphate 5-kinase